MRKSIKKAVAFTLAAVTMFANLSVTAPVKAAEYGEVKEVLPNEYDNYIRLANSVLFYNVDEILYEGVYAGSAITDMVIVNENGEKTTLETQNSDGTYIYGGIDWGIDEVLFYRKDGTQAIYYSDGTWFGNGKEKYDMISMISDDRIAVKQGGKWNIVDKNGKMLVEDICDVKADYGIRDLYEIGDYIVVKMGAIGGGGYGETAILDKNYKKVTNIDLSNYEEVSVGIDKVVAYNSEEVSCFDSKFEKIFTYKPEIVENPSSSTEYVLTDYYFYDAYMNDEFGVIGVDVRFTYEHPSDEPINEYKMVYFDLKNFKEITEDEVADLQKREYTILNSDLVCKTDSTGTSYYYGTKKVADYDSIVKYVEKNKGVEGCSYYALYVYNGDVYFDINSYSTDYTLVLEKASGYSLEKAKILDKGLSDGYNELGGCIVFDDGTAYFNGKVYEKYTDISYKYSYNQVESELYVSNYVISKTEYKDGKCETVDTLYDKNHTEIYKTKDNIAYALSSGIIVIGAEDEKEGYKYGCKYVKKTLVNSQDILDELVTAEEGDTIEVELKKNDPVKAEVFETIKGKDVNVVLNLDNGMSWKINGKNVKGSKLTDINLTVDVVKDVVPAKAIDKVNLKGERIELSLAHTGEFGFSAELTMNVKKENAGKFANRFYYNPETKELEFQEAVKIDANGDATFTYTHASDYVIILSDVSYETMAGKPGDMANIGILVALLGTAGAAMFVFQKKRDLVK